MIEKGKIIKLDDNREYLVISKCKIDEIICLYLVDIDDNKNIIYVKLINDEVEVISDSDLLDEAIKKVNEDLHTTYNLEEPFPLD